MDEETRIPPLQDIQSGDISVPIPDPTFLLNKMPPGELSDGKLLKFDKEYDKFCQWIAIPKEQRKIKSVGAFERKYGLSKGYTGRFKKRKDFHSKRLAYFWDWMWENFPDVVNSQLKLVLKNGNTAAAKFFAEIIAKHIDVEKPAQQSMQNFFLVGVDQSKIDRLFTPKKYVENVKELTPIQDGE